MVEPKSTVNPSRTQDRWREFTRNLKEPASFDAHLRILWNLWYALIGGLTNGPLEMFFFVWLVVKTDHIFKSEKAVLSWGFLGTTVLFGLVHVITT